MIIKNKNKTHTAISLKSDLKSAINASCKFEYGSENMLCWNVYCGDFNGGEIKVYNLFNHWAFYNACVKAKKKFKEDYAGFEKEIRSNLMYYFWSKCEWEIILDHWPSGEFYDMRSETTVGELTDKGIVRLGERSWQPKPEVEVSVRVFPKNNRFKQLKIDVYQQVMNNWDIFINYLWENRKELKERKV